jgi:hypothetical protein
MRVLLGIDDTDNLESRGTGFRARELARKLSADGLASARGISRHQLYVHPDIPYTSHNSALCLDLDWRGGPLSDLAEYCRVYLTTAAAEGSDAGYCVAPYDAVGEELVSFGRRAKSEVLTKSAASALAQKSGLRLEGVTGDHGGIIGALSCLGLRKTGHDGRFVWVRGVRELEGVTTVRHLLQATGIDLLQAAETQDFDDDDRVEVSPWPRPVLLNHKAVLLIEEAEDRNADYKWKLVPRERTKQY